MRPILQISSLLAVGAFVAAGEWSPETRAIYGRYADAPLQITAVSFSDWYVFKNGVFGVPGVRAIINEAAAAGTDVIMWRSHGGGVALYPSQVAGSTIRNHADGRADYNRFDSFAEARDFTRQLGRKLFIWITPLEEAHGEMLNSRGRYTELHPQLLEVDGRTGKPLPVPSFFYPEYRHFKAEIFQELVNRYSPEGVVIDFERRGAPTRGDRHGYIPEALRQFNRAARKAPDHRPAEADPEWKKFRAEWVGEYLREARRGLRNPPEIVGFVPWDAELHAYGDPLGWLTDGTLDAAAVYRHASGRWGVADTYRKEDRRRFPGETAKYAIIYLYGKDRDAELEAARSAAEAGFTGIIWMESANLSGSGRYAMTRRLAGPDTAELISPEYDLSRGGDLQVLATGEWRLVVGDFLASGSAGKLAKIVIPPQNRRAALRFTLSHPPEATAAGLVVEGEIGGTKVRTAPETWRASAPGYTLTTVSTGIPGIPPFLECNLEDDDK